MPENTSFAFWEDRLKEEGLSPVGPSREIPVSPSTLDHFPKRKRSPRRHITLPLHLLTSRQREVIFCLFYDTLSEGETAQVLGISRRSVRTHKERALEKLKKAIGGSGFLNREK